MFEIKVNEKDYRIPESFDEMTLGEYCNIFHNLDTSKDNLFHTTKRNEATILSRIMGEDDEFALSMPLPLFEGLMSHIQFIYRVDNLKGKNEIKVNEKRYKVPTARELSLRQWIDIDVIANEKENRNRYIDILAVLLNEIDESGRLIPYQGKYELLSGELSKIKCSEGLGIVYHFFWKGENLRRTITPSLKEQIVSQHAKPTKTS